MDILAATMGVIRVILGLFLLLFLPGYAITWVLYPEKQDVSWIERLGYSFILSIVSVMLSVLFIDILIGIDTTAINIVSTILVLTALAFFIWRVELYYKITILPKIRSRSPALFNTIVTFKERMARRFDTYREKREK